MKTSPPLGQTIPINEMEMYHEIRGAGEPLVVLHGGAGAGVNWDLLFKNALWLGRSRSRQ